MKEKDERMAVVTEVINSIRAIKLHGWEPMFEQQIAEKRNKEIVTLKTFQQLGAVCEERSAPTCCMFHQTHLR